MLNHNKILKVIKDETIKIEDVINPENKKTFVYLINKKISLQFHDMILNIKMRFTKR